MTAELEKDKKCGLGATLLAAALPYLAAFSFGEEAQAAQNRSPNDGPVLEVKDKFDLSQQSLPQIRSERLPDGREITSNLDLKTLPVLKIKSSGEWVEYLQNKLNESGAELSTDGKFGNLSEKAVIEFQRRNNIKIDGQVGTETWGKLLESSLKKTESVNVNQSVDLSTNQDLRAMLRWHEGVRTDLYKCTAGKCTIGVGHNLDAKGSKEEIAYYAKNSASSAQIEKWLTEDIRTAQADLDKCFGKESWYRELSANRKCALLDLCFNMGIGKKGESGLLDFQKMLGCLENGNYAEASKRLLMSRYAEQVGARAHRVATIIATDELPQIPQKFY
jgi:lysozyme